MDAVGLIHFDKRVVLSYREKVKSSLVDMYEDRARLHKEGYQHRTVKTVER